MIPKGKLMAQNTDATDIAWLWLLSDFPVEDNQRLAIRELYSQDTSDADLVLSENQRLAQWPLRVCDQFGPIYDLRYHVFLCVGFLVRRQRTVEWIRQSGCNLELNFRVRQTPSHLSLASATMEQLSRLQIQLSFSFEQTAPIGERTDSLITRTEP